MKTFSAVVAFALAAPALSTSSPIAKVIEMVSGLQAKIVAEGEDAQKVYDEFAEWCEDTSKNLGFEIKTGKQNVAELKATIEEESSNIDSNTAKVEELAATVATADADLKAATTVRNKEKADFTAQDKELVEVIDTIGRASDILAKEMNGGASMMQLKNANGVVQALEIMVKGAMINSADGSKLTALVQSAQTSEDSSDDESLGAPAAATYENQSGGILEVLAGLQEDAQTQLDDARKKESESARNYAMLKQSLDDQIKYATQDTNAAKKDMAKSGETKAGAEGELEVTTKDLTGDMKALGDLHRNCMEKAQEFEAGTKSRGEELNALATAKKVIKEATSLAQTSFMQVGMQTSSNQVVRMIQKLARDQKSKSLAQLAARMASTVRLSNGGDVFGKIKGLISEMIEKLENQMGAEATEKAYCDKEMGESNAKKDELTAEIEKLTTKVDQDSARSTKLKEEVAILQKELSDLAKSQASWTAMRKEEKAVYDTDRAEMEKGLTGIKTALQVLRDYYASGDGAQGAGGGIISLLEVCESDFSKALAETIATEESAVAVYEKEMKDMEIEVATKDKDVEYKTKEHVSRDKTVGENSKDRAGVQSELDAVQEYLSKLEARCIAKPESYESKKARREAEIAGLKEALTVLGGESLLQKASRRHLRVVLSHH